MQPKELLHFLEDESIPEASTVAHILAFRLGDQARVPRSLPTGAPRRARATTSFGLTLHWLEAFHKATRLVTNYSNCTGKLHKIYDQPSHQSLLVQLAGSGAKLAENFHVGRAMKHNTTDSIIRSAIRSSLATAHQGEDAVIVDELKVSFGSGRIDVAVINGRIEGYEIKSDKDKLDRLSRQASMFGAVADRMTLVVGQRHLDKAVSEIPDWWGVIVCSTDAEGNAVLKRVRRGRLNRKLDKIALIETLERDELVSMLASANLDKGFRGATYRVLVERASSGMAVSDISAFVKKILKVRARLAREFGDLAFGRSVILCAEPSATGADLRGQSAMLQDA